MFAIRSGGLRARGAALALALAALLAAWAVLLLSPAHAAIITVNTTTDELNADGDCSLREAIQAANTDAAVDACAPGSGTDTISVPSGTYTRAIPGTGEDANATGDLDITADLTITGGGAATTIIDGAALDVVLDIHGGTVEISGLTIQNGSFSGGITNAGTLTLNGSAVSGNTAVDGDGGGIHNQGGTVTLNSSTVSGNSTTGSFGGSGGGIQNDGTLTLNSSTVSGNTVGIGSGGGIYNGVGATATLTNSNVSGNTAAGFGGGIFNGALATLTLNSSTVSANLATQAGGGIQNNGTLTLNNSTVSGNSAGGSGGGITNEHMATLNNSTISGNSSACCPTGGILNVAPLVLMYTIVAGVIECDPGDSITSAGHNLIDPAPPCPIDGDTTGNILGSDPLLGPLADNGGPTQTHALLSGSPAIDAGSPDCPPPATDQRGVARPQGAACDIGAYEFELPTPTPTQTPSNTPTNTATRTATPPPPVGGISLDPAAGALRLETTGVSGLDRAGLAGAIAAVTMAALTAAAALWYWRRRA